MLKEYQKHVAERSALGLVPKPLSAEQVSDLVDQISLTGAAGNHDLLELITHRVPPGVDPAAAVKAEFLTALVRGEKQSPLIDRAQAAVLLGTMKGGYNIEPLINLLDDDELAPIAAEALAQTTLVFDACDRVIAMADENDDARRIAEAWAEALWFTSRPEMPAKMTLTALKVEGEINTDDLSPAGEAWSRPDIPLHALAMLKDRMDEPLATIADLKEKGHPLVFVGDVVGTGSSRKSAANSVLWHIGQDIPYVPNKRQGGVVLGGKIAPIFFNTMEDSGALPVECDVTRIQNGDILTIYPYEGRIVNEDTGQMVSEFSLKTDVLIDEVRAGGRIPLIVGRNLTEKARSALGLPAATIFRRPQPPRESRKGFTLAQKMVGAACGKTGVRPGEYCEPAMTTVGSQDTTGPMTRDELRELACLRFSADLVMQSFCHTAAYPKPVDVAMHNSLPDFITKRGGVALRPGDGVVHSWLNRMILPDTVGTGGDSHTRFPMGISFPAGSGLVAFGAALGIMPLDMPESVRVRFSGSLNPGITIRDVVNAIPYTAIQSGLLTVAKEGKVNVFSGRILEMDGLPGLSVDQAFELTDATAERSASAGTISLGTEQVADYLRTNVQLLKNMLAGGYQDSRQLNARISAMESWLDNPRLLTADADGDYAALIDVDLTTITEPIVACPNDPDDVRLLSEVAGTPIDDVFIGSCMTHADHFRTAARILDGRKHVPARLWIAPPTRMDADRLKEDGLYAIFAQAGARLEIPGCSLCMGNQARVPDGATVFSTSTRNFPNRMGDNTRVFLGSAELAAVCAILGRIPGASEYRDHVAMHQHR